MGAAVGLRRVAGQPSETARFCNSHHSPAPTAASRVQNPCPKSTSHNPPVTGFCDAPPHGPSARYVRVSTTDQQPQLQIDALERAGGYRVFTETASGARTDRPTLEQLLDQLRPGDTLVVWKLDRLGRSLRHLVDTVTSLAERGIGFRSLQEAIDTTTPGGKLVFHVFAALAEFERDLIRERTAAGLEAARVRGRQGGRPSVMTAHKVRGGWGDVPVGAVYGGGDRDHAWGQPGLDLPPRGGLKRLSIWARSSSKSTRSMTF